MGDQPNATFINKRHAYLERRARQPDNEWARCYCGMHLDEKAELLAFRRRVVALEREAVTPLERLKAAFNSMNQAEQKATVHALINGD